ncbi:MAG: disulfide reductase [Armatimonadetes bacterium]|nr:disulfide reductase [Armatimonadota bacterium]
MTFQAGACHGDGAADEGMNRELSYYPGCSLHGSAREYDHSTRALCEMLDIHLQELDDWSCCGASSAHAFDRDASVMLPARNLAIAAQQGKDVLIPCAACYGRTKAAQKSLAEDAGLQHKYAEQFGSNVPVSVPLLNLPELLSDPDMVEALKQRVRKPLTGLRAVCYYGCLLMRPPSVTQVENYETPETMERVFAALGGTPVPWSYKTECCGGGLVLGRPDIVNKLVDTLCLQAEEAGAEAFITACPMCQGNLDMRQKDAAAAFGRDYSLPVFYISELAALALGYARSNGWWRKHLVNPRPLLREKGLQ